MMNKLMNTILIEVQNMMKGDGGDYSVAHSVLRTALLSRTVTARSHDTPTSEYPVRVESNEEITPPTSSC